MALRKISASYTRPADTTTYAAGDVLANSTSAPVALTFTNVVGGTNGSGEIKQATLVDNAAQTLKLECELWLFHTAPVMDNDNAVFTPTDAEIANLVTVISFPAANAIVGDATSGLGGNAVTFGVPKNGQKDAPIFTKTGSRNLYGVVVVRNAYVPISGGIFTFTLFTT